MQLLLSTWPAGLGSCKGLTCPVATCSDVLVVFASILHLQRLDALYEVGMFVKTNCSGYGYLRQHSGPAKVSSSTKEVS